MDGRGNIVAESFNQGEETTFEQRHFRSDPSPVPGDFLEIPNGPETPSLNTNELLALDISEIVAKPPNPDNRDQLKDGEPQVGSQILKDGTSLRYYMTRYITENKKGAPSIIMHFKVTVISPPDELSKSRVLTTYEWDSKTPEFGTVRSKNAGGTLEAIGRDITDEDFARLLEGSQATLAMRQENNSKALDMQVVEGDDAERRAAEGWDGHD